MTRSLPVVFGLGAVGSAAVLWMVGEPAFAKYFGALHPVLAASLVAVAGVIALGVLDRHGFGTRRADRTRDGVRLAAVLGTLLGVVALVGDVVFVFPADTNVLLPNALLFYPLMGYVAEVVFHLVPLAALLMLWLGLAGRSCAGWFLVASLVLVSTVEPAFQVAKGGATAEGTGADLFLAAHVFAISLAQLLVYRRYDFLSAFTLRLVYYAWWHIIWGHLRLQLLF